MKFTSTLLRFICLFLLSITSFLQAQTREIDSLKTLLKKAPNDSVKVAIMNNLSFQLGTVDAAQGYSYAKQAVELAEKSGLKSRLGLSYNNLGIIYDQRGQGDSALIYYNKALKVSKKIKNIYIEASALGNIGYVYWSQGDFNKALDYTLKGLAILDTGRNYTSTANSLEHVAMIYYDLKDYKNSVKYHRLAIPIYLMAKAEPELGGLYCNMALNYLESSKDSMIFYLKKAEAILLKYEEHWGLGHVYNNIGGVYIEIKNADLALLYLNKAINERRLVGDDRGMCSTHSSFGMAWLMKGRTELAKAHLDTAVTMAKAMDMQDILAEAYRNYALVYAKLGLLDSVTSYLQKESDIQDTIFSSEKTTAIADMQTKYDTEKKDLEIAKQKAELEAKEIEKKRQQTFIAALIGLVILIILLGYFIYSRNKIRQKARMDAELANQREIRSKAVIEAEEKERRRIAQDLHDGVGQILSAAKLNLSGLEDKLKLTNPEQSALLTNALDLVNDSVKEVREVSHNMMPNTLIKLGLASAVREFITKISSVPNLKIDLQIVGMEERLDNTVETVLYRVIQEVVSNIIKHAKANVISMQLIRHENELTIMIEDNGVGFDKKKVTQFEGIGLKNIISRVEFLSGNVDFDTTPGQGTTVVIEIPLT
jgi:signal transduction histidine kinase